MLLAANECLKTGVVLAESKKSKLRKKKKYGEENINRLLENAKKRRENISKGVAAVLGCVQLVFSGQKYLALQAHFTWN